MFISYLRRQLNGLAVLLIAGGFACANVSSAAAADQAAPPNILLIVAEDMSSRVGAFGDSVAKTPSIDQLAEQGLRYTNVFTTSGVCAPSRAALITGAHAISTGTQHHRTTNINGDPPAGLINYEAAPPAAVKAFPELLRRAGYATANLAKTDYQFGEPFTIWDINERDYFPQDLALWRDLPGDKPFFVMLNLMVTHESFLAPPLNEGEKAANPMLTQIAAMREKMIPAVTDPGDVKVPPYLPDTPEVRASIAQFYDNIHYMDRQVGEVLARLEEDGLADNTIVIWTTDHGDAFPRAKRAIYDSGIKVPLVVRFPDGSGKGSVNDELVSFVDLAPTLLGLAGVAPPDFIQGRNFLTADTPRDYVYAARDRMNNVRDRVRAVRDGRYKYLRNYLPEEPYFRPLPFRDMFPIMDELWAGHRAGTLTPVQNFYFTAPRPREELYDTVNDPHEIQNLAGEEDYTEVLERMRGAMDRWLARVGDKSEIPEMEMIKNMWPGLEQPVTAAPQPVVERRGEVRIVSLSSATTGASIGYRIVTPGGENSGGWNVYSAPVTLKEGETLEAKAIRYGYAESPVAVVKNRADQRD